MPVNGPSSMSHPQVPTVPRMPTDCIALATRSGWATVPASTTVVTPFCAHSIAQRLADSSSSSAVCSAWIGTAHSKIDAPGASRSGMQLRTNGSPVKCWWALIMPGVTTQSVASITVASGCAARSSLVEPTATMSPSATTTDPPTSTSRALFIVTTSPPAMMNVLLGTVAVMA